MIQTTNDDNNMPYSIHYPVVLSGLPLWGCLTPHSPTFRFAACGAEISSPVGTFCVTS
ncbi:hypothetical protein Barb6_02468 [Bacteroidales bacterium Barb6]|nr:hypothetical protein Barb6_02468 [Bacteroidales bacterium Barb6]